MDFATATSSGSDNYSSVIGNLSSHIDNIFKEHQNVTDILLLYRQSDTKSEPSTTDILNRLVKLQEQAAKPSDPWSTPAIWGAVAAGVGLLISIVVTFFIGVSNFMKDRIVKSTGCMSRFVRYITGWTDTTDDLKKRIDELEAIVGVQADLQGTLVRRNMLARMDDFDVALIGLVGTAGAPGRMGQAEADLVTATTNIAALSGRINKATNGATTANSRLATVSANVIALGGRIDTLGTNFNSLSSRVDTGVISLVQLSRDVVNVQANVTVLKGNVKAAISNIIRLDKNATDALSKAKKATKRSKTATNDVTTLKSVVKTADTKLNGFLTGFLGTADIPSSSGGVDFADNSLTAIDERIKKLQNDFREHESAPAGMAHVCV
ncbi:hypothetical protein K4K49_007156 [Colletotrichum sp. SAR 10_70]|nr:hypothetical protein K4K50_002637 [Colletotrichum sp. SAR 10_71]KAI8196152.1 hypothetical protein K4K49_007156 [Colletotrichum sp. SAR 10_70]KAJ4998526.1 hypothetical protein K4K48_005339 [Colletotrichum sp. SAR 10_66]